MAKAFFRNVRSGKRKAAIANLTKIARQEIDKALEDVQKALVKSHEVIVRTWRHQPTFVSRKIVTPSRITVVVFPTGENAKIWTFVDEGTKPHVIKPKRAKMLSFKTGYKPKTLAHPARTVAGGGVARGPRVFAKQVHHPGSEGRGFTEKIAKDIQPEFRRYMENAFRRAARRVQE